MSAAVAEELAAVLSGLSDAGIASVIDALLTSLTEVADSLIADGDPVRGATIGATVSMAGLANSLLADRHAGMDTAAGSAALPLLVKVLRGGHQ